MQLDGKQRRLKVLLDEKLVLFLCQIRYFIQRSNYTLV